jgi:hypothetical protein
MVSKPKKPLSKSGSDQEKRFNDLLRKKQAEVKARAEAERQTQNQQHEPGIGDKMPDGTILAGVSPDTGKPLYTTPLDAGLHLTFAQASRYVRSLDVHGHQDWRIPSIGELKVLFNHRTAIGGFRPGPGTKGWYWCSSPDDTALRFYDGLRDDPSMEDGCSSLRCVR